MFGHVAWAAVLAGLVLAGTGRGDDKAAPLDRAELDRRTARVVYEATAAGTEIYNKGNHEGCFRLYQGTLAAILPYLDHHPAVAAAARAKFDAAGSAKTPIDGAFALREGLDVVANGLAGKPVGTTPELPTPAPIPGPSSPTAAKAALWERLGGEKAVRLVVHDFVTAAAADPKVNFFRNGRFPLDARGVGKLEQHLVELVSFTTGGPLPYTGRSMKQSHADMKITAAEFDATAAVLAATLKKLQVPQTEADELLAIVAGTKKDIVEVK